MRLICARMFIHACTSTAPKGRETLRVRTYCLMHVRTGSTATVLWVWQRCSKQSNCWAGLFLYDSTEVTFPR